MTQRGPAEGGEKLEARRGGKRDFRSGLKVKVWLLV